MNFPRPLCLVFLLPQARHVLPAVLWGVLTIVYCIVWSSWLHTPSLATTVAVLPKWWTLIQRCLGPFLLSSQTVLCRLNAGESWKRYRTHLMWLHFQRAKVGSVFDVAMCKIWVRRSATSSPYHQWWIIVFSRQRSTVWLPLDQEFALWMYQ